MVLFGGQEDTLSQVESGYRRDVAITNAQPLLKRVILVIWTVIDVILVAIFLVYLVYYLAFGGFRDREYVAQTGENIFAQSEVGYAHRATSLLVGNVDSFSNGDGSYDFLVEIENTNDEWWASFDYQFLTSGGDTEVMNGFVLPGETRPVVALGIDLDSSPVNDDVFVNNIEWHRIDHKTVDDIGLWMDQHGDFILENAEYSTVNLGEDSIGNAQFDLTNAGPYGYWSAQFLVMLERGGRVDAVNIASIAGFEPGEERHVTVNYFGTFPSTATISVYPMMNYFDEDIYIDLEQGDLFDYRDEIDTSDGFF